MSLDEQCRAFVAKLGRSKTSRPTVTLTWAQSIDGRIASRHGNPRLILSGRESMQMTFWLRAAHQAIMISASTLNADDSQLTVRDIPFDGCAQPTPVIIDAHLDSDPKTRALQRPAIIFHLDPSQLENQIHKCQVLQKQGHKMIVVASDPSGRIPLDTILEELHELNITSVLVEPGLRLIPSLLGRPDLLDNIVVTIAPVFVGDEGRAPDISSLAKLNTKAIDTMTVGKDVVFAMSVDHIKA